MLIDNNIDTYMIQSNRSVYQNLVKSEAKLSILGSLGSTCDPRLMVSMGCRGDFTTRPATPAVFSDPRIFPEFSAALLLEVLSCPMGDVSSCHLCIVLVSCLLCLPVDLLDTKQVKIEP